MSCGAPGLDDVSGKAASIFTEVSLNFTKNYVTASLTKAMMDAVERAKLKHMPPDDENAVASNGGGEEQKEEADASSSSSSSSKDEKDAVVDGEDMEGADYKDPLLGVKITQLHPIYGIRCHAWTTLQNVAGNNFLAYLFIGGTLSSENSVVTSRAMRWTFLKGLVNDIKDKYPKLFENAAAGQLPAPPADDVDVPVPALPAPSAVVDFPGPRYFRSWDSPALSERHNLMRSFIDFLRAKPAVIETAEFKLKFGLAEDEDLQRRFNAFASALEAVAAKNDVELDDFDEEVDGLQSLNFRVIEKEVFPKIIRENIDDKPEFLRSGMRNALRSQGGEAIMKMSAASFNAAKPAYKQMMEKVDELAASPKLAALLDSVLDKIFGKIADMMKKKDEDKEKEKKKKKEEPVEIKARLQAFSWGKQAYAFINSTAPAEIQFNQYVSSQIERTGSQLEDAIRQAARTLWYSDLPYSMERPLDRALTLMKHLVRQWFTQLNDACGLLVHFLKLRDALMANPPQSIDALRAQWHIPLTQQLEQYMVEHMAKELNERRRLLRRDRHELQATLELFYCTLDEANSILLDVAGQIRNRWAYVLSELVKKGDVTSDRIAYSFIDAATTPLNEGLSALLTSYVNLAFGVAKVVFVDENKASMVALVQQALDAAGGLGVPGLEGEELAGTIVEKVLDVVAAQILKRMMPMVSKWLKKREDAPTN